MNSSSSLSSLGNVRLHALVRIPTSIPRFAAVECANDTLLFKVTDRLLALAYRCTEKVDLWSVSVNVGAQRCSKNIPHAYGGLNASRIAPRDRREFMNARYVERFF